MARQKLNALVRRELGTRRSRRLRRQGRVPAILYGNGEEGIPLTVKGKELFKILRGGAGEHSIIDLHVEDEGSGEGSDRTVIVKEVQHDFIKDTIQHVDFTTITLDEKIVVSVPVRDAGEAVGVAQGGVLQHLIRELEVECLPTDLPNEIEVDVSNMGIHDSISVQDLVPPPGVKFMDDPERIVITVTPPKIEEEKPAVVAEVEVAAEEAVPAEGGEKEEEAKEKAEGKGKGKEEQKKQ